MPNWVDNYMTILVPRANKDALMDEMKGPNSWQYPLADVNGMVPSNIKLSNHQELALIGRVEDLIAQFRALPAMQGCPDWMPVSKWDLRLMLAAPDYLAYKTVPFSVARLLPIADREEFDRLFPGQMTGPFWDIDPEMEQAYNSGNCGGLQLCRQKVGTKWPPSSITLEIEDKDDTEDMVALNLRYQTPYSALGNMDRMMVSLLERHGARMCVAWLEEDCHSGYDYIDPSRDMILSADFGQDNEEYEEEEDGSSFRGIDREKLRDLIINAIDDPEMPLFF